jgi:hypothetical protein
MASASQFLAWLLRSGNPQSNPNRKSEENTKRDKDAYQQKLRAQPDEWQAEVNKLWPREI